MRFLLLALSILLFFRIEVLHFFVNFTFLQWILLLGTFSVCLFLFKRKIKYSLILLIRKFKYFNVNKYRTKLSRWARENNSDAMGKSLVSQLKRNVSIKLGCIFLSVAIFNHYPSLLISPTPATIFLLTLTAYSLISFAFRKETLIFMIGLYLLMAFMPYALVFLSHYTDNNFFETIPADVVYLLNINISNLTQTANKLFLFTAPWVALTILFLILSSVIIRGSLKLIFSILLKVLKSLNPA